MGWDFYSSVKFIEDFPGGSGVKNPSANAGDVGLVPGSGRFPEEGNGYSLQYSCLGNPMERGAWWATIHGVMKSWTQLSMHTHTHTHTIYIYQYLYIF